MYGNPFLISQENCLHCGICFESCPVDAVEKLP
ncbi:4Fe-4S binding protein [Methanosphaera sp. BMS]